MKGDSFKVSHQRGALRLRSLREFDEAANETIDRLRGRFDALRSREPVRAVSAFNLFQTPEARAHLMVRDGLQGFDDPDSIRILEPSAGLGRIYRAIRNRCAASVTLVEIAEQCCNELTREIADDDAASLVPMDFLDCSPERLGTFDLIVMNPPFKMGRDIKHIRHAQTFLNPGGRLVSLCFGGQKQRKAFEDAPAWNWNLLPSRSFHDEGTNVDVASVRFELPE